MSKKPSSPTKVQPLILRKNLNRLAIGLFAVAGLIFGWQFLSSFFQDPDVGTVQSSGWISAVKDTASGTQAVIIKPDGTELDSPDYSDNQQDHDVTWQPDGQRIFFSSNRSASGAFHIFRWNPAKDVVQDRSIGGRAMEKPVFDSAPPAGELNHALVISGGIVVDFNPKDGSTRQMLPIVGRDPTQEEGGQGAGSQFGPEYQLLGSSFRSAQWCMGHKYIVGVMERDKGGETLVIQNMDPQSTQDALPKGVAAGDHIEFSVDSTSGRVVYSVQNWQVMDPDHVPPQYIKNNKIIRPFAHILAVLNPDAPTDHAQTFILTASPNNSASFGSPKFSPDGSQILFAVGDYQSGLNVQSLVVCPAQADGGRGATPLLQGSVFSANWSPNGKQIIYVLKGASGKNDLWIMDHDGGNPKNLTNGKGNYSDVSMSPELSSGT